MRSKERSLLFQKAWEYKNKFKMDQRKNGTKPPFFRNSPQGKPSFREPRKDEMVGKMPRQPPMECWGCKGNYRYIDYPHINDKVRDFHNVQHDETMEDMGSRIPKIYTGLEKKKEEYQSHMIEAEGMINNQPFTILIDLGASHSYIDPRVVESLQLSRSKHGKYWLV
jgi:hypothetical protein